MQLQFPPLLECLASGNDAAATVLMLPFDPSRYSGFVKSTVSGLVTWSFASDGSSRVQVRRVLQVVRGGFADDEQRCG